MLAICWGKKRRQRPRTRAKGRRPDGDQKLRHEEDVYWESDGQAINVEDTQALRDREPLPHNPPPGPKWQAKQGMARLPLNGAEYAVLACLIDRASKNKGACYPSQEFICGWTFRPERTVKRAVAGLRARKLVTVVDRGTTSNAYIIDWKPIFAAYQEMKRFEKRHALRSAEPKVAPLGQTVGPEVARHVGPEVARKPMKGTSELREPMALSGSSDDEPYLVDIKKVEESLQREQAVELSPSPQTPSPAEPLLRERANKAVFDLMTPFDWDHCTEEAFEAAIVAEMAKPGSGRAIVVASSSEAWSAKRKGDGQ